MCLKICSKGLCKICDMYDFLKKKLEVLRLLSRAVNEYESEGELCRQITNNLNK